MKRAVAACLALLALAAMHSFAAEPAADQKAVPKEEPSSKPAADAPQPVIPDRKLTFDISEEQERVPFGAADPELAEQRYVATFSLVGPARLAALSFGPIGRDGYRDALDRHSSLLLGGGPPTFYARQFKSALSEIPHGRGPTEEVVSLLTKGTPCFRRSIAAADPEEKEGKLVHFTILAPTAERAKELVEGVLSFYDYGVFYPLQKEALAVKAACQKRLEEDRAGLKAPQSELATLEKELEKLEEYADITPEALVSFTAQQRLISVDMQGVKARIDACNKILASPAEKRLAPSRIEQLETLNITAEIELVGLAARKQALEEIVKKGQERKELSAKRVQARSRVRSLETDIFTMSEGIRYYEGELKKCMPYAVVDGKVVIRRINWVSPRYTPAQ